MQYLSRSLSWIAKPAALVAALSLLAFPLVASAQFYVGFNVGTPPPPLPYYSQPALSVQGDVWQPGYWAWGPAGYYWVPGTWVAPAGSGQYWTPGYWGYDNGGYAWNNGYWGPSVGYYGGINYGYGYNGSGFNGGNWNNGVYMYNTAMANVGGFTTHVYVNRNGVVKEVQRYSYNGPGGVRLRPTAAQFAFERRWHVYGPTRVQVLHAQIAGRDRNLYYSVNHGRPTVLVVGRPIENPRALDHYTPLKAEDHAAPVKVQSSAHGTPVHTTPVRVAPVNPVHAAPAGAHAPPVHTEMHAQPAPTDHKKPPSAARIK